MQFLYPVITAAAAGGAAMLVSGNLPVAIGAAIGSAIGVWLAEKKKAPSS